MKTLQSADSLTLILPERSERAGAGRAPERGPVGKGRERRGGPKTFGSKNLKQNDL